MDSPGGSDDHSFDYSKITDNIYIGSDLCKGNVCPIHAGQFKALGVRAEINLTAEHKETPPDEMDIYAWIPVKDHMAPSPGQFDLGASIIDQIVSKGKTIYVHCKVGHGRSPTMVAAYLIRYKGMGVDEAISFIAASRPGIHPEDLQKEALVAFQQKWSK
jgi:atypical dual specificity phosphatase